MGNRPKIWLNDKEYVYRSDFNWYKEEYKVGNSYHNKPKTDQEILDMCFKYSHRFGNYKRGDFIKIKFNGYEESYLSNCYKDNYFEIMRVDYNGHEEPQILLVRPEHYRCHIPAYVSGLHKIDILGKREA